MLRSSKVRVFAFILVLFAALAACNKSGKGPDKPVSGESLLRFVPADTPYLFASGEPLPDDVVESLEPRIDEVLKAYQIVVREIARSVIARNAEGMDADEIQRASAIVDELTTLLSIQGMRDAGFERHSGFVMFGHGLLPVIRMQVSDPALFDAAIVRIEKAAGEAMDQGELDGQSYRYVGDDDGSLVLAAMDDSVVFTFIPAGFDDDQKRQLLGLKTPPNSIAGADTLPAIIDKYGYSEHYVGFIDNQRIASTFIDTPKGLDAALMGSVGDDAPQISDVCKAEIRDMVGVAPRIVFGYDKITANEMDGSFVLEMRPDLAKGLTSIAALVPGLGHDPGGLLSMGFSFNLLELRTFYEARLDAMDADPFECEYFQELQAGVAKGREALNQPVPPIVYGFRGFNVVVDNVGDFDMANDIPPKEIDASLLVAMENAQAIVAMGAMFSPDLAQLNLQPDGKPVRLDLPQLQATGQTVYAAMIDDAVALSVGNGAEKRVQDVLGATPGNPPPVFGMTMDAGRYYGLIADSIMIESARDDEDELSPEARKALADAMQVIAKLYDRMAVDMHFTPNGVEFTSKVSLND